MFCCLVRLSTGVLSWGLYNGYSVCSGLFWGERWWSVGAMAADGVCPGLGCILQSCVEDDFLFIMDKSFGFSLRQMGVAPFSFLLLQADLLFRFQSVLASTLWCQALGRVATNVMSQPGECQQPKHTQHAPSMKAECGYPNGWIIFKRLHTQKSDPKWWAPEI